MLAYDRKLNPDLPAPSALGLVESQPPFTLKPGTELAFGTKVVGATGSKPTPATLVTFADAGADGGVYRVWLRAPGVAAAENDSLLANGTESRSRQGNQHGSINDDDFDSIVVTFDGKTAKEDWFAVTLAAPVSVRRVVFAHGRNFPDGGWFDASAGKPRVQVQRDKGSAWETLGELSDYPATTATDNKQLTPGQSFTLRLSNPEKVLAARPRRAGVWRQPETGFQLLRRAGGIRGLSGGKWGRGRMCLDSPLRLEVHAEVGDFRAGDVLHRF